MDNISPNTLFIGQHIRHYASCESTNTLAQELLCKNEATEGTVIITSDQTKGRGQRGNSWEAQPGQNITLSVVLAPRFLGVGQQFYLNMAVALAVLDFGARYLPAAGLAVKWPNDLYWEDRKWGGILLENTVGGAFLSHSVVGIGVNINQTHFGSPLAVSFATVTGQTFAVPQLVARLLEQFEKRYLQVRQSRFDEIRHDYLRHLYRYQEEAPFLVNGERVTGQILGVDAIGQLAVQVAGKVAYFQFKEIAFLP